ncbi:UNVERIFIED_CONTAM: hypothetical protein Slati_2898300 [Sesamum latifolium]|uniref:Uncharacterized protein n=1 Tax=Sesamum latifolium TaxID=2727402 RepID=A0AAW2VE85_9LAMI
MCLPAPVASQLLELNQHRARPATPDVSQLEVCEPEPPPPVLALEPKSPDSRLNFEHLG